MLEITGKEPILHFQCVLETMLCNLNPYVNLKRKSEHLLKLALIYKKNINNDLLLNIDLLKIVCGQIFLLFYATYDFISKT